MYVLTSKLMSSFFVLTGTYFPGFFLQLYAIGINPTFAFYSVLANFKDVDIRPGTANDPRWWAE
jgi:hypothetical protein